jgi:hypothetical protein
MLDELEREGCPSRRTATFRPCERKSVITKLKAKLVAESEELQLMHISCDGDGATVEMTAAGLGVIRTAVESWLQGSEDFGVHPQSSRLPKRSLGKRDRTSAEIWFWGPCYYAP